jgi:hypothetical protein
LVANGEKNSRVLKTQVTTTTTGKVKDIIKARIFLPFSTLGAGLA